MRDLLISSNGNEINADIKVSHGIMLKAAPNAFADGIEGVGVHPMVVTIKK